MSFGFAQVSKGFDDANNADYTITSFSWNAGDILLLGIVTSKSSTPDIPQTLTQTGLNWVRENGVLYDNAGTQRRLDVYRTQAATNGSGSIAVHYTASQVGIVWEVIKATGADLGGTSGSAAVVQSNVANGTTGVCSVTLLNSFLSTSDGTVGFFASDISATFTQGTGFTLAGQQVSGGAPAQAIMAQYRTDNSAVVACTCTNGVSDQWGGIALEIKAGTSLVLSGSSSSSGTVSKGVGQAISGSSSSSGGVNRGASRSLSGSSVSGGTTLKTSAHSLSGSSDSSGTIIRQSSRGFSGASTSNGTTSKSTGRNLSGLSSSVGVTTKTSIKSFMGSTESTGTLNRAIEKTISGASSSAAILTKYLHRSASATIISIGTLASGIVRYVRHPTKATGNSGVNSAEGTTGVTGTHDV